MLLGKKKYDKFYRFELKGCSIEEVLNEFAKKKPTDEEIVETSIGGNFVLIRTRPKAVLKEEKKRTLLG